MSITRQVGGNITLMWIPGYLCVVHAMIKFTKSRKSSTFVSDKILSCNLL